MWETGNQNISYKKPSILQRLEEEEDYVTEEKAREYLVPFLKANLGLTTSIIAEVDLFPVQEILIKTMFKRDYVLAILSRGFSKTYSTAIFCFLYAIFEQGAKIAIIARVFRQSRQIFKIIEDISKKPNASILKNCITDVKHSNDEWSMKIGNSEIKALPISDGEKLRGFRFNCIVIDELLLMPEHFVNEVITPFLSVKKDAAKVSKTKKLEDELIKQGLLKEEERTKFTKNKMIGLSSASFKGDYLYKTYMEYIKKIVNPDNKAALSEEEKGSYAVFQFAYDIAPEGLYDEAMLKKSKSELSSAQFAREFGSQFTDDGGGYYSIQSLKACMANYAEQPVAEIVGDPRAEYILAVDPSFSETDDSDFFAMLLFKLLPDEKPCLVHAYAVAGGKYKDHAEYFYYLKTHFNIVFVTMDGGGGGIGFLQFLQDYKKFANINIYNIENVDFDKINQEYIIELNKAKINYNLMAGKIVYQQYFSSDWIRRANEYLQATLDHKRIKFASDIGGVESEYHKSEKVDIDNIGDLKFLSNYEIDAQYSENNESETDNKRYRAKMIDLIERQQELIALTINQCASIQVKTTDEGHQRFVLADDLKKEKGPKRARKDLYTCLVMGNWAIKCYQDIKGNGQDSDKEEFVPFILKY